MRGNGFQINYGGEWLDVDAQSVGGFDFTTLWTLDSTRITEKGRTLDLSVPATTKNTRVFNDHKLIPGDGVRRGINGMIVAGGVNITGTIYVSEYIGGRYSLMMAYGQSFGGFKRVNYAAAFAADTMTLVASDVPQSGGVVPDFGWYEYGNETSPHATVYDGGALLFPSANLGHIIDSLAASLGYTVNYPHPILGRGYQAHAYGLILPSFGVDSIQGGADVSGSAKNGFSYTTSGVATLADLGLETATRKFSRGYAAVEFLDVEVLRATKPVHISVPANSGVVVCGGVGYDVYNDWDGTQGAEFDLLPGQYFSFVRANEWHMVSGEYFWNRYKLPPAFEGNLSVTFSVTRSSANPVPGETMRLASALPEHPLEWWLDVYCNIIFAAWTVDESMKTITVKTYGERYGDALADAGNHISLEKEKVIAIESVKKYVDGFAQENHTRCDGKYDNLGSVLPFDRVLAMDNEYLEKSRDMAVIPFNDGGIQGGHDERFYLYLNDVTSDGNGGYNYDGVLTVFFENNVNTDGAVSLQEILNMGVGLSMDALKNTQEIHDYGAASYDDNDYNAYSWSSKANGCTKADSTTYSTISTARGVGAVTYVWYDFAISLPPLATIDSVTCLVKCRMFAPDTVVSRTAQMYSGGTAKGSAATIPTNTNPFAVTTGTWTAAELEHARIKLSATRGSNANTNSYFRFYGVTLTIVYTWKGKRLTYTVSAASSATVRMQLPLFRFAGIGGGTCVSLHGRDFVVRNAKWSEGVAQLEMMSVPRTILDIPRYFPNAIQDYDGNWYDAVVLGDQVWLAQNLRTTHYADGTTIPNGGSTTSDTDPYYYDYSSSGIPLKDRGYLYNWPAVMKGAASSDLNPSGVQGIAPAGWHVPSDAEWTQMTNYVGGVPEYILNNDSSYIAKALASQNYWDASTNAYAVGNDLTANNKTLFGAVPSGYCLGSSFYNSGSFTYFISSTQDSIYEVYDRNFGFNYADVGSDLEYKVGGFSVRCVCDLSPMDFAAWYYEQYGSYNHQL